MKSHFLGLRTIAYAAPDLAKTRDWYAAVLGIEPYFDMPFYVGFNVGGYELGLQPDRAVGTQGQVAYWGVEDIQAALDHVLSLGATINEPLEDVGDGIQVVTVNDPFGNAFGMIKNPHFNLG
jgi:predicted enzyme related to lactoylglutathione lyase